MFDIVFADGGKTVGVLFGIPDSRIERPARVASKANWAPRPGLKLFAELAVPK